MPALNLQVNASARDRILHKEFGSWALCSAGQQNVYVGYADPNDTYAGTGFRFLNATIPVGSTITAAYLTFRAKSNSYIPTVNSVIIGEKSDGGDFADSQSAFQNRRGTVAGGANNNYITSAYVSWNNIDYWIANYDYNSPDIKTIIQEIINSAGWASGNAIVLFWDDFAGASSAYREAYSYDGSTTYAPKLHIEYTCPQTLTPSDVHPTAVFGTPKLNRNIRPSGIASALAFGSPALIMLGNVIFPSGVASGLHFGTPALRYNQTIIITGIARTTAFGMLSLCQGNITAAGIGSALVFGMPTVIRFDFHVILDAHYSTEAPDINRTYIIGQIAAGTQVSGAAVTQADVDLVGERMDAHHDPAIITDAVAAAVAVAQLAKARMDGSTGRVIIPPHCGLELWDVLNFSDLPANQAASFRVAGYTLEYDTRKGIYRHTIDLCGV